MKAKLILENGEEFEGQALGYFPEDAQTFGEVVFNTGMTGYQEIYTDPSYCDQIVCLTYPMIGNYGLNKDDYESLTPHLKAVIVHEACETPSHYRATMSLHQFLERHKIPGLSGIDTRKLTKILRGHGTMKGILCPLSSSLSYNDLKNLTLSEDQINRVSCKSAIHFPGSGLRVVLMDFGYKKNILTSLQKRNCDVIIVPYNTSVEDIDKYNPDGILLSNGPGDPKSIPEVLPTIQNLQTKYPLLGICMGHQIFALANGADTEKLKFGHRGCNHPVKDLKLDRVFITSQNHGYTVKNDSIKNSCLEVTQLNLNDETIEGLKHNKLNAFSVQYHPEANPGPNDTAFIFDQFFNMMKQGKSYAQR